MKPIVSILIPTYNHAHFIPYAIRSALDQTFQDFEIIIVDDGSKDETRQVVAEFSDPRIKYIYQANKGLSAARNTGIRFAQGEYLAFLDADDLFLKNKLTLQVGWLSEHPNAGLVAGGWNLIDDLGQILEVYYPGPNFPDMSVMGWLRSCHVCPISVLVSKDWVERVQGFDETLRQVEDWDLWLRLAYAGCQMGWVNDIVCSYRLSAGQMTRNAAVQKISTIEMMDKFYNQPHLPKFLLDIKTVIYTRLYLNGAGREFGVGQWQDAQKSVDKAIENCPGLKSKWNNEQVEELFSWEDSYNNRSSNRLSSLEYREYVFSHLPATANALQAQKRILMIEAGEKTFFWAFSKQKWPLVRKAAKILALNKPGYLLNKGFWSILFKSLLYSNQSQSF